MPTEIKDAPAFVPAKAIAGQAIKISQAKEPPKEVLDQNFDGDLPEGLDDIPVKQLPETKSGGDTLQAPLGAQPPTEDKTEEKKTEEPPPSKKEEKKPDLPDDLASVLTKPGEKPRDEKGKFVAATPSKEEPKPITPEKITRDYSSYSPEQAAHLKQMSNEAYQFTTKLIQENKDLAKLKDSNYLQHPQAYVLSPEFQELSSKAQLAQSEGSYWQQQLQLIKEGNPWKPIRGYDKDGNAVFDAERQPTPQDEEQVRLWMNHCINVSQQIGSAIQQFPSRYQNAIQNDTQLIQQEMQRRFAWVSKPELMNYAVQVDGQEKTLKQVEQDFVNIFPSYLQNNLGVKIASNMMIALVIQGAQLKNALAAQAISEVKKEEALTAEPTSRVQPKDTNVQEVHGIKEFSIDGLPD